MKTIKTKTIEEIVKTPVRDWTQEELERYARHVVDEDKKAREQYEKTLPRNVLACPLRNNSGFAKRPISRKTEWDWVYTDDNVCPECGVSYISAFGAYQKHP